MKVRLDGSFGRSEKNGCFLHGEALEMHQDERIALVSSECRHGAVPPSLKEGVSLGVGKRRRVEPKVDRASPRAQPRPTVVVLRRADEDPVEPHVDRRFAAEGAEAAERPDERVLHDVFGRGVVPAEKSPRQPVRPVEAFREERVEVVLADRALSSATPHRLKSRFSLFGRDQRLAESDARRLAT